MNRQQIRLENELKENRYCILTVLNEYGMITESEFKSYATMIIKMYEKGYYDEYEHILDEIEENALIEIIELMIEIIDDGDGDNLSTTVDVLVRNIEAICIVKQYSELAKSILDLSDRLD